MHENKAISEEDIRDVVDVALMDKEKAIGKMLKKVADKLGKALGLAETDEETDETSDCRVVIDREHTELIGTEDELLTCLAVLVGILHYRHNFSEEDLQGAFDIGIESEPPIED